MRAVSRRLRDLPVKHKLLLGYSSIFLLVLLVSQGAIYLLVRHAVQRSIEHELATSTATIAAMVQTSAHVSVRNRLRAIAEKDAEIVRHFYDQYKSGKLTEAEARERAEEVLLSQTIGYTGYVYCLNSSGVLAVHPKTPLVNKDLSEHRFIRDQISRKVGYIEYEWKNPGEARARPKALYMTYFEPWDWIISASSYRDEFASLVDLEDFRESILSVKFGKTGYPYVISSKGDVIIHPSLTGAFYDARDSNGFYFVREMCAKKNGVISYTWQNPGEADYRQKLAYFTYLPDYDWIVVSSSYQDEFFTPLIRVRQIFVATAVATLVLLVVLTFGLGTTITKPLEDLRARLQRGAEGDLTVRADVTSQDEVGELGRYFNHFMEQLETEQQDRLRAEAERSRIAEHLRQSEKLEAVGQLAGGVAHDFNNLLSVILGHAEVLQLQDLPEQHLDSLDQIVRAATRAAGVTRSLLDFSRKSALRTELVSVDAILLEVASLLEHTIDKRIRVVLDLTAPAAQVRADAPRLQNAFLNLALNARDAMPEGGELALTTRAWAAGAPGAPRQFPEGCLEVVVRDTGSGMEREVLDRVFEPFFTTKAQGKGTGLGLASVYGCVQAHEGDIEVESARGVGTTFRVYLPLVASAPASAEAPARELPEGSGHILVVDDEPALRAFAQTALATLGYTSAACPDGAAAIAYVQEHPGRVSLVVLDLVMPGLDGHQTYAQLRALAPRLPVLFCSGYTERSGTRGGLPEGAVGFLQKPYGIRELALAVDTALMPHATAASSTEQAAG